MLETRIARPLFIAGCSFMLLVAGLVGGGAVAMTTVWPYLQARDWRETKAEISSLLLVKEKRSGGGRGGSNFVRCEAIYTYIVKGKRYKGNRASLILEDPFGNFQERLCTRLGKVRAQGNATAFYNIADPNQSALVLAFAPELLSVSLVVLSICGGAGLAWFIAATVRVRYGMQMIGRNKLQALERDWPLAPLLVGVYFSILAICSLILSIDSLMGGWPMGGINFCFGLLFVFFVVACILQVRRATYPGNLLMPDGNCEQEECTLLVPMYWRGDMDLKMNWVKETSLLSIKRIGKESDLLNMDWIVKGNIMEVIFTPSQLAGELNGSEMVGIRISGKIGDQEYKGTFMVGKAFDYQAVATRRDLGLLFSNAP